MKSLTHYKVFIPLLFALGFFIYWVFSSYLFKPFVWDEIVSLTNFVLVDFKTTVTEYPDVNNHIFFNLLNNIYCKILSVKDLYHAMDQVWVIRLLPFALSLLTLSYVYLMGRKFFNPNIALIALFILITTIPFLNFTMQLRGYTISTTLFIASTFHLLSFERKPSVFNGIVSLILVTLLMYSIPSNVFFAISLGLLFFIRWIQFSRAARNSNTKNEGFVQQWVKNRYFVLLSILAFAAILSYLLYLPVLDDLLNERHLQQVKGKSFYAYNIQELIPNVLFSLTSYRYLLALPFIVGIFTYFSSLRKFGWSDRRMYATTSIILLFILPFVISLVRGDKTPERSFVPLSSFFALMIATSIYSAIREIKMARKQLLVVLGIVFIYCVGSFYYGKSQVNKTLHKAILDGEKINTSLFNFYQSEEYDLHLLDPMIQAAKETGLPILMAREIDRVSEGEYLLKNDLNYYSTVWSRLTPDKKGGNVFTILLEISQGKGNRPGYKRINFPATMPKEAGKLVPLFYYLMQNNVIDINDPKCYVLTFSPRWFEKVMRDNLPQMKYEKLNRKMSYHNVYLISKK